MGKAYWSGDQQPGALGTGRRRLCLGCRHPIVYGDRCGDCQRKLRERRRRKPR